MGEGAEAEGGRHRDEGSSPSAGGGGGGVGSAATSSRRVSRTLHRFSGWKEVPTSRHVVSKIEATLYGYIGNRDVARKSEENSTKAGENQNLIIPIPINSHYSPEVSLPRLGQDRIDWSLNDICSGCHQIGEVASLG